MRFAKYKGPEISNIEAHNERRKEKYASNLNKQAKVILDLLADTNPLNAHKNTAELDRLLRKFFREMGKFLTKTKQYDQTIRSLKAENVDLKLGLKAATDGDMQRRLAEAQLKSII